MFLQYVPQSDHFEYFPIALILLLLFFLYRSIVVRSNQERLKKPHIKKSKQKTTFYKHMKKSWKHTKKTKNTTPITPYNEYVQSCWDELNKKGH